MEWQPIETAPKGSAVIGGEWCPEQGGYDWRFFMSWWAKDHWLGHPSHWCPLTVLPQPPAPPHG